MTTTNKFKFYHKGAFIKVMICANQTDANAECRSLEQDYKLKKYSIIAVKV